jgi:hypothetical protein
VKKLVVNAAEIELLYDRERTAFMIASALGIKDIGCKGDEKRKTGLG